MQVGRGKGDDLLCVNPPLVRGTTVLAPSLAHWRERARLDTRRRDLSGDDWALLLEQLADTITAGQPLREGVAALLEDVIGDALGWKE